MLLPIPKCVVLHILILHEYTDHTQGSNSVRVQNTESPDIMRVALNCFECLDNREEHRIPEDGLFEVQNDPWMMKIDFDTQKQRLEEYIWGE